MRASAHYTGIIMRILVVLTLCAFLLSQSGCSSAKKGMVPCPCHKKSQRR